MNPNVYALDKNAMTLRPVPARHMADLELKETVVETWLASLGPDASVLGRRVLWLARQDSQSNDQRSDLVGLDVNGDLLVVELKRGLLDENTVTQALSYAAEYCRKSTDELAEMYSSHCTKEGATQLVAHVDSADAAKLRIGEHVRGDSEVNSSQILVLVGEEFTPRALAVCDYLNSASGEAAFTMECWQYAVLEPQNGQYQFLMNQVLPPISIRQIIEEKRDMHKSRSRARDAVRADFIRALTEYLQGLGKDVVCFKRQGETYVCHLRLTDWPDDTDAMVWNHINFELLRLQLPDKLEMPSLDALHRLEAVTYGEDGYGRYVEFDDIKCATAVFSEQIGKRIIAAARALTPRKQNKTA